MLFILKDGEETGEIIKEIKKLSVQKRIFIIERTLKKIRESENRKKMVKAAKILFDDYQNDRELTAFTQIDYEAFYETK